MKILTTYQCEACGHIWDNPEDAKRCESYVAPPCPLKVGDPIMVYARYGEPQQDVVAQIDIVGTERPNLAGTQPWYNYHEWNIITAKEHQIGKDTSTNSVELHLIHRMDGTCVTPWVERCAYCECNGSGDLSRGWFQWNDTLKKRVKWERPKELTYRGHCVE